jgi:glutamyl-tRNA synthetase
LGPTGRQILLMRLLGYRDEEIPTYTHVPLVVAGEGERLAKRLRATTIRSLRERGLSSGDIVGMLARALGLGVRAGPMGARALAEAARPPAEWRKMPWPVPDEWSAPECF